MEKIEKIKKLTKRRSIIKGKVTRFTKFIDSLVGEIDLSELEVRTNDFPKVKEDFEIVQDEIDELLSEVEEEDEREEFETKYYKVLASALSIKKENTEKLDNTVEVKELLPHQDDLQRIKVPVFSGQYEDWLSYKNMFSSMVLMRKDLSNIKKFHYLKTSLSDEPLQAIKCLELSEENFKKAWEELERRYENKKIIAERHIKALFNEGKMEKESAQLLKVIVNNFVMHVRALESLGESTQYWDTILIYLLKSKLDYRTLRAWEDSLDTKEKPTFNQCVKFLEIQIQMLESLGTDDLVSNKEVRSKTANYNKRTALTAIPNKSINTGFCIFCKQNHMLYRCYKFLNLSISDRWVTINNLKCCVNCLRYHDLKSECRFGGCKQCQKKHHSLLHTDPESNIDPSNVEITLANPVHKREKRVQILLATALVDIEGPNGRFTFRALLDSGSQSDFITERAVKLLGLKRYKSDLTVCGIGESSIEANHKVNCTVHSRNTKFGFNLECIILSNITQLLPSAPVETSKWKLPQIDLADPTFFKPNRIDLLVGGHTFWQLIREGQFSVHDEDKITLQNTHFGWIVSGQGNVSRNIVSNNSDLSTFSALANSQPQLEESMQRFWHLEHGPDKIEASSEDIECESHFAENFRREEDGRFVVRLPLKATAAELGNPGEIAKRRFYLLENKLRKNETFRELYKKFMDEYESLGHMTKLSGEVSTKAKYFLPHHAVVNDTSTTTKLRVVFDPSCKTNAGYSLNDLLSVGPVVQDDLVSILIRFRQHQYAFVADVEKMYRQIKVEKRDRTFQQIRWRSNPFDELQAFQLFTVTCGTSFLVTRCLIQLVNYSKEEYPEESKIEETELYVDDALTGHDSLNKEIELQTQLSLMLRSGWFRLRESSANHAKFINKIPEADRVHPARGFQSTGVDYGGPLTAKRRKDTVTKSYISLSVCMRTKAIHIELVNDRVLLTFEESYPAFTQIEACYKSRPLYPLSSDSHDLNPLTPAHFLVGEPLTVLPSNYVTAMPSNCLIRLQRIQRLVQYIWKRWVKEYLPTPNQRTKWKQAQKNLEVDDLVLNLDEPLPPAQWKLRRILSIHPGQDGMVRTATLKTANGVVWRPIEKLCPLPLNKEGTG